MIYGSVCSGIEAASVAWHPLGWRASFLSEIDAFPRAVLAHHYPKTPLHGDFTTINAGDYEPIKLLVGGTPCQSFSVAGLRGGLGDERGNLALEYLRLAKRLRPDWLVWENVPGVLSSNGGRDFGSILGAMVELGYGFAYRVLDAQFFGVPQRRRRVFVVGYFGNWRPAFAVLFERHGLQGHPAPRRATGKGFAAATAPSLTASGRGVGRTGESRGQDPVVAGDGDEALGAVDTCPTLRAGGNRAGGNRTGGDRPPGTYVDTADSLIVMSSGQTNAEISHDRAPTLNCLHEAPILAAAYPIISDADRADSGAKTPSPDAKGKIRLRDPGLGIGDEGDPMFTLQATKPHAVAIRTANTGANGHGVADEVAHTLDQAQGQAIATDVYTLAIRGRGDGRDLETRTDGTANAILTPNGGRDGIGVGAVAFKASHYTRGKDGAPAEVAPPLSADADKGDQDTLIAFSCKDYGNDAGETAPTLRSMNNAAGNPNGGGQVAICCPTADSLTVGANQTTGFVGDCVAQGFAQNQRDEVRLLDVAGALAAEPGMKQQTYLAMPMQVRRLTPKECERLQGFPDGYTNIPYRGKPAADGPRYKALGNSMAVPVMRWIGERIQLVDGILAEQAKAAE